MPRQEESAFPPCFQMQVTTQGDNIEQHGHTHNQCPVPTQSRMSRAAHVQRHLNSCLVEDPGGLLLHLVLSQPSYKSHIFLAVPGHTDPQHVPHAITNYFTFSPHHPPCILCIITQHMARTTEFPIQSFTGYIMLFLYYISCWKLV